MSMKKIMRVVVMFSYPKLGTFGCILGYRLPRGFLSQTNHVLSRIFTNHPLYLKLKHELFFFQFLYLALVRARFLLDFKNNLDRGTSMWVPYATEDSTSSKFPEMPISQIQ